MTAPTKTHQSPLCWNDPASTWRLASYQPPTERRVEANDDRRDDTRRQALGDRRRGNRRSLRSLLRI